MIKGVLQENYQIKSILFRFDLINLVHSNSNQCVEVENDTYFTTFKFNPFTSSFMLCVGCWHTCSLRSNNLIFPWRKRKQRIYGFYLNGSTFSFFSFQLHITWKAAFYIFKWLYYVISGAVDSLKMKINCCNSSMRIGKKYI